MVRLRYSSYILHTKSTKVHVAESSINKPVFNVQRSMLNVGSWANYSELCIYILVYCTATQSFLCLLLENFSDVSLWVRESTSQQNTLGHTPVIYLWCSTSGFAMVVRASSTTGDQLERSDRHKVLTRRRTVAPWPKATTQSSTHTITHMKQMMMVDFSFPWLRECCVKTLLVERLPPITIVMQVGGAHESTCAVPMPSLERWRKTTEWRNSKDGGKTRSSLRPNQTEMWV